mgnify:CR=1 FL=1
MTQKTVTKTKAAELLGVSKPTIDAWVKNPTVKLNGIRVGLRDRILLSEINELKKYL